MTMQLNLVILDLTLNLCCSIIEQVCEIRRL